MNKVILIGRLGAKPETRHISDTASVTQGNLATSERYTNKNGEKIEDTEWHKLVIWNKQGQAFEQYLDKGSEVAIEGKIRSRQYDDKDGIRRYITEILVDKWEFTGGSKVQPAPQQQQTWEPPDQPMDQTPNQAPDYGQSDPNDDLPF
jgi:single-strand DNA-binding protein